VEWICAEDPRLCSKNKGVFIPEKIRNGKRALPSCCEYILCPVVILPWRGQEMTTTRVLQEIRRMRFKEAYEESEGRLTQAVAAQIQGCASVVFGGIYADTRPMGSMG